MKEQSQKQQKNQLEPQQRLQIFGAFVDLKIVDGVFDEYLEVTNDDGEYPVVTAIDSESLYFLNQRVTSMGGKANIFIDTGKGIDVIYAMDCSSPEQASGAEDLSTGWENGDATVGAFLDYIAFRPQGVLIPSKLEKGPITKMNLGKSVQGVDPKEARELHKTEMKAFC